MSEASRKHSQSVLLRFEPEQLELIDRAAEFAGLNRTAWIRSAALKMARAEVAEMDGKGKE